MALTKENIHSGHRARMREKLSLHGDRVFQTYELLEMLLYHAVAYKNTNTEAKLLMAKFGSVDRVFSATKEELMSVKGVGEKMADVILAAAELGELFGATEVQKPCEYAELCDYDRAGRFAAEYFRGSGTYGVIMLLLDNRMKLIGIEELFKHDFSSAAVRSSAFIAAAIKHGAAIAIIAHNHPFGPIFPSEGDIATNSMIEADLRLMGVTLAEHYLVSGERYVGFMQKSPAAAFSQNSPMEHFILTKEASQNEARP